MTIVTKTYILCDGKKCPLRLRVYVPRFRHGTLAGNNWRTVFVDGGIFHFCPLCYDKEKAARMAADPSFKEESLRGY